MRLQTSSVPVGGYAMEHVSSCCAAAPWWLDEEVDSPTSEPETAPIPVVEPPEPAPVDTTDGRRRLSADEDDIPTTAIVAANKTRPTPHNLEG